MEHFPKAAVVRLRGQHKSYLISEDDEYDEYGNATVKLGSGASRSARWTVEHVLGSSTLIRLRSQRGRYLSASGKRALLGTAGQKVLLLTRADDTSDWEPRPDGYRIKLRSTLGTFLRGNGSAVFGPYRNTVTHGDPQRTITQESVFWDVDIIDAAGSSLASKSLPPVRPSRPIRPLEPFSRNNTVGPAMSRVVAPSPAPKWSKGEESDGSESSSSDHPPVPAPTSRKFPPPPAPKWSEGDESDESESFPSDYPPVAVAAQLRPPPPEGRIIHYYVLEEGEEEYEEESFPFQGSSVEDLTRKVEQMTGLSDLILCIRDVINGDKLRRLRLTLPPNRKSIKVVAVPSYTSAAKRLMM